MIFELGGRKQTLFAEDNKFCRVATCESDRSCLFRYLKANHQPSPTKSRKFNREDKYFIDAQAKKLLDKVIHYGEFKC